MHFSYNLEDYRSDPSQVLSALNFPKSFAKATHLKFTVSNGVNKEFDIAIPHDIRKSSVEDVHYALVENLAYIQEKTGYGLRLPKDPIISKEEIKKNI